MLGRPASKQLRERVLERRRVDEAVLHREHDEPQFGHWTALGLQVDGLRVQQCAADRDHEQRSAADARALLVPQRQLSRKLHVLIDARLDLQRPVDEPRLREVAIAVAAAFRRGAARPRTYIPETEQRVRESVKPNPTTLCGHTATSTKWR